MNQRYQLIICLVTVLLLTTSAAESNAQNNAGPGKAANSAAEGPHVPTADAKDEIAKMLRRYYDAWTKLDATVVNNNFTDDGFVSDDGKMISSMLLKAHVRLDFASTPTSGNYHFEVEDLRVFQPDTGTVVANYRLTATPSNKKLATIVENITDIFVRRDGQWLIFAEHVSDLPKPVEPIISGLPSGWHRAGKADSYLMYVDAEIKHGGKASASIKFNCGDDQYPWASLGQPIAADEYRGKRVRLSGWLKTIDASEAALWMRIDGEQRLLALDLMNDRAVSGTTDWRMYSLVLDVPNDTRNIFLGVLLNGKGQAWADDLTFEVVDRNIAVTNKGSAEGIDDPGYTKIPKATIKRPINLGFEEGRVP